MELISYLINHIWLTILILIILLLLVRAFFQSPSKKRFNKNLRRQIPYLIARYFT